MSKCLKKEQVSLLRFEKKIAGLAATLAAGGVIAKSVDGKLNAMEGSASYTEIQAALVNLAEVTTHAHAVINAKAAEAGLETLQVIGGVPKRSVSSVVASIFGIG